jgi:hypothetical protein
VGFSGDRFVCGGHLDSVSANADAWHVALKRWVLLVAIFYAGAGLAFGDGGALILQQRAGSFDFSVFATPSPLRAGRADFSVLVQDAKTQDVVLDGAIDLDFTRAGEEDIRAKATPGQATNKLLYAATVEIPRAGEWDLGARCRIRGEDSVLHGTVSVLPPEPPLLTYWPYFLVVPLAIFLFALNHWLKSKRRSARLPIRP